MKKGTNNDELLKEKNSLLTIGKNFCFKSLESQKRSEYTIGIRSKIVKVKVKVKKKIKLLSYRRFFYAMSIV
jgi:hypothetical protein